MEWETITRLLNCFPNSIINHNGEFIAHVKTNQYLILSVCKAEKDIKCKMLEWLSRSACKALPYKTDKKKQQVLEVYA